MNKKIALVTLIEASFILSDEDRMRLLDLVPGLNDRQVEALGKFFALERQFVLAHEDDLRQQFDILVTELERGSREKIYIGTGKPA